MTDLKPGKIIGAHIGSMLISQLESQTYVLLRLDGKLKELHRGLDSQLEPLYIRLNIIFNETN